MEKRRKLRNNYVGQRTDILKRFLKMFLSLLLLLLWWWCLGFFSKLLESVHSVPQNLRSEIC